MGRRADSRILQHEGVVPRPPGAAAAAKRSGSVPPHSPAPAMSRNGYLDVSRSLPDAAKNKQTVPGNRVILEGGEQ